MTFEQTYNNLKSPDNYEKTTNLTAVATSTTACSEMCATAKIDDNSENTLATIHCKRCKDKGVNYYLADNNSEKAKFLRVLIIVFATICTIYVCILSSRRYFNSWVQTVIERTDVHVSEIPFPAVTICPVRGVNILRLQNKTRTAKQPPQMPQLQNENEMQEFLLLLHTFNDILWSPSVEYNNDYTNHQQQQHHHHHHHDPAHSPYASRSFRNISFLDNLLLNEKSKRLSLYDLNTLLFFLTFECEDIFAECIWRRTKVSCCHIFHKIETYKGVCFAFNSMHAEDPIPSWPWVVSDSGLQTGLQVLLKRSAIGNFFEKIVTMVHDPNEIGTSDIIYLNGESVVITVTPLRFTADYDIHTIRPELRHCYFTNELKLLGKSRSNCMRNCRLLYIERNCNCTYIFPVAARESTTRSAKDLPMCGISHLKCIYKHRSALLTTGNVLGENIDEVEFNTLDCKCYPNCNYIQYRTMVNTDNTGAGHGRDYIDLQVQYQHDTLFSYRSTLCFNLLDLIVSYGGIAGLFLGLSLVGIIELLHDFIVCWKIRTQRKRLKTHVQQYENAKTNNNNSEHKKDVNSIN